jgi:predicted dehydrogenase
MAEFAKELPDPVKYYTDYKAMCADPEIDAVFIGTPNQWHVPIGLEAVKNGKHVLVTKPLADSEEAARKLVDAAEEAGVVNMMSLSTRFADEVRYLGDLIQAGDFGEVYYARSRSVRRSGIPSWSLGFVQAGGGAFRDMGVHMLDSVWWLLGMPKPSSVLGVSGAKFGPRGQGYWNYHSPSPDYFGQFVADDYAGGFINFENGIGLQIESFWASHQPEELQIELFGTEAGAKLRPLTIYRTQNGAPQDVTVDLPKGAFSARVSPGEQVVWDSIADHFIACILDGIECEAPLRHGLIVQEMMEGLLRSAALGREVRFES